MDSKENTKDMKYAKKIVDGKYKVDKRRTNAEALKIKNNAIANPDGSAEFNY